MLHRPADDRCGRYPDRGSVRYRYGAGRRSRFLDPRHAGHLAVAVLGMDPGGTRIARVRSTVRVDRRDPRPDVVAFDQRGVPDLHTGHIRERVVGPGPAREGDPEGTSSRLPGGRLEDRCLRPHAMLRGSVSRPRSPSTSYLRSVRSIIFWIDRKSTRL